MSFIRESDNAAGVQHWTVADGDAGRRIDNYLLSRLPRVPRSRIYRMLRSGELRVNGGRVRAHYRVAAGDRLRIPPVTVHATVPGRAPAALKQALSEAILEEHPQFLVINKPGGLSVHGGSGVRVGLIEALRQLRSDCDYLELVHRLDRDTSGCLLVAKEAPALRELHRLWRSRDVDKRYLALLRGHLDSHTVNLRLDRRARKDGKRHVEVTAGGRPALSHFGPQGHYPGATLSEIVLATGRTHQIRAHAAAIQHPVAGDRKYGDREFNGRCRALGLQRLFLHASRVQFSSQVLGEHDIRIPLPADLSAVLDRLAG